MKTAFSDSNEKGDLGEIVVFIDGQAQAASVMEFACALAEEHGAHLIGVFMQPAPTVTVAETFARGTGMLDVAEAHQAEVDGIEADQRALFDDVVRCHGVSSEWRLSPHWSTDLEAHAHYADLAVVARPDPSGQTAGPPDLVESLVLSSGRPIIVLPPSRPARKIRRVLVAWNAGREAVRAVADALPLIIKAEDVQVLIIDPQRETARYGPAPGADIARHLARHSANVEVRCARSDGEDVGAFLLSQAAAFGADLIVMGAYGHSHLREWVFGGITQTVLRQACLPVLMSR